MTDAPAPENAEANASSHGGERVVGAWSPPSPVDEGAVRRLVEGFYAKVREDADLGPVFNDAVHDWPEHLQTLTDFWCSAMLGIKRYNGRPVPAHFKHRDRITPELFVRWLSLWRQTTREVFAPEDARLFIERAELIARSLQFALFERIPAPPPRPGVS